MTKVNAANSKIDKQIGANLAYQRAQRGMTQAALGALLVEPITRQAVDKYEKGLVRIPAANLAEFAAALKLSVTELYEGVDVLMGYDVPVKNMVKSRADEGMIRAYHALQDEAIQSAMRDMVTAVMLQLTNHYKRIDGHE